MDIFVKNKPWILKNRSCAYCLKPFSESLISSREHVIGRRFVPKGTLNRSWNLILNACANCNSQKSDLEDDISTISMMPDAHGRLPIDDERLIAEIRRKSEKSISRLTQRPVAKSIQTTEIKTDWGPLSLGVSLVGPPQIQPLRVLELASYHFKAFFYAITIDPEGQYGHQPEGVLVSFDYSKRSDWGSVKWHWFMKQTKNWPSRLNGIAADGFFKIHIRKHPAESVWSWALEWNHTVRIAGFAGQQEVINSIYSIMPDHDWKTLKSTGHEFVRKREEISLAGESDTLFLEHFQN